MSMSEISSAKFATVKTLVVQTDEERSIALQSAEAAGLLTLSPPARAATTGLPASTSEPFIPVRRPEDPLVPRLRPRPVARRWGPTRWR